MSTNAFGLFLLIVAILVTLFNLQISALLVILAIACFLIGGSNLSTWNSKAQAARQNAPVGIDRQIAARQRPQDGLVYFAKEQI
jgi:hypothetical protein